MAAYYNEIDRDAADWLEELIRNGHIADGIVDRRSIEDVKPLDLTGFTQCHFFAGIGVWSHALRLAGWSDDRPVWTGSCPCQPFSAAGKGAGFNDERHLWPHWHWLISQCRPAIIFGEQVASKDGLAWLDLVSSDVEASGYAFGAADLCAAGVGAPHIRQRSFWVADADDTGSQRHGRLRRVDVSSGREDAQRHRSTNCLDDRTAPINGVWRDADWLFCRDGKWRPVEPGTFPLAHGSSARVGRLRAYGNAIVPQVAATFIGACLDVR